MNYFVDCAHLIKMSAISGRENSLGGRCPVFSISRTFVPLGATLCSGPCGQVLLLAIFNIFFYLDQRRITLGLSVTFLISNTLFTLATQYLGR